MKKIRKGKYVILGKYKIVLDFKFPHWYGLLPRIIEVYHGFENTYITNSLYINLGVFRIRIGIHEKE